MYWVTIVILLIYAVLVLLLGRWLPLHGYDAWVLRGALLLLGLIGAGVVLWFQHKTKKAKEAAGEDESQAGTADDLDGLVREAIRRLKQSALGRGSNLGSLPLVYVLGDSNSTKTTILIHSALDPELLAGQVYRENEVLNTTSANLWYTRQAIFVDPAGSMMSEPGRWRRLVKLLQPARFSAAFGKKTQAPRAALVCFDCETFLQQGAGERAVSAARRLSTRLQEISQLLGISFPIYVLFTKLDRISFFTEFVRQMSKDEVSEVLGATLPLRSLSAGVYADEETRRLTKAFDEIFYSLAERRIVLLPRENDGDKLPGIYEFPRELKKLRTLLVQFLVDLARPSHLGTNPFLRGFYFTGVRPIVVDDVIAAPVVEQEAPEQVSGSEATKFFQSVGGRVTPAQAPARVGGPRRMPQWVFLTTLFNDILVKDRVALAASGSSSHVNLLRRIALGAAVLVALIFLTGFTISFFENRGLESRVRRDVDALKILQSTPNQPATIDDLRNLDDLRGVLADLSEWEENGAPWRMRWGLYEGHELYADAMPYYFNRFGQLLFNDTKNQISAHMLASSSAPLPNVQSDPQHADDVYIKTYKELQAYLITTSASPNSCYTTNMATPLAQVLLDHWRTDRPIDTARQDLAARQFDFYTMQLLKKNWLGTGNSPTLISQTQAFLNGFAGLNPLYARLKTNVPDPGAHSFNDRYSGSREIIDSTYPVHGAFTRQGYLAVQSALQHPSDIGGDACVLGPSGAQGMDPVVLRQKLTAMYNAEFVQEWNKVLQTSRFRGYQGGWGDADTKLQKLTLPTSPQLELIYFISHNVDVAPDDVKAPFAAVKQIGPPPTPDDKDPDKYAGPAINPYINALVGLEVAVHPLGQSTGAPDQSLVNAVTTAEGTALQAAETLSSTLPIDHSQTPGNEQQVRRLLEEPIKGIENLVGDWPAQHATGSAKGFCAAFGAVASNYPFKSDSLVDAPVNQLYALFGPNGDAWKQLTKDIDPLVLKVGSRFVKNPQAKVSVSPSYLAFLNHVQDIGATLYPNGSQPPHFTYTLRQMPSNLEGVVLKIGNETLSGEGAQKDFVWTGEPQEIQVLSKSGDILDSYPSSPWAVFRFVARATQLGGGKLEWVNESNGKPIMLTPTKQKSYDYQLQVSGPANPFFDLRGMKCSSSVIATGK